MTLGPGYRFALAPSFHLEAAWESRFAVGAGLEQADGYFFPRGPWRPPTPAELALLTATADAGDAVLLFRIPDHLRGEWWELLDASAGSGGPIPGFEGFAAKVAEFLAFKKLAAPGATRTEAIVTAPGERSIRRDPETNRPAGLGSTLAPWSRWPPAPDAEHPRLHAVVNLGDEPTAVVLVNLPFAEMARRLPPGPAPGTVGELVTRFLRACPEYPPVRVRLGPGEGCRLPAGGVVLDGDPTGKDEPDILLLVSAGG